MRGSYKSLLAVWLLGIPSCFHGIQAEIFKPQAGALVQSPRPPMRRLIFVLTLKFFIISWLVKSGQCIYAIVNFSLGNNRSIVKLTAS